MSRVPKSEMQQLSALERQAMIQFSERLTGLLAEEENILKTADVADHDRLLARKEHMLVEAVRLAQRMVGNNNRTPAPTSLHDATAALRENAEVLARHIRAASELCDMVCEVYRREDSDGTYTSSLSIRG